jgi:hypothetical protein
MAITEDVRNQLHARQSGRIGPHTIRLALNAAAIHSDDGPDTIHSLFMGMQYLAGELYTSGIITSDEYTAISNQVCDQAAMNAKRRKEASVDGSSAEGPEPH